MKKKVFRKLYNIAEKVLGSKGMKKLDEEIGGEIKKTIDEIKDIKHQSKKSGKNE